MVEGICNWFYFIVIFVKLLIVICSFLEYVFLIIINERYLLEIKLELKIKYFKENIVK